MCPGIKAFGIAPPCMFLTKAHDLALVEEREKLAVDWLSEEMTTFTHRVTCLIFTYKCNANRGEVSDDLAPISFVLRGEVYRIAIFSLLLLLGKGWGNYAW